MEPTQQQQQELDNYNSYGWMEANNEAIANLSLSDIIALHNFIEWETDLMADNIPNNELCVKIEEKIALNRLEMAVLEKEIEKRRSNLFIH